MKKKSKAYGAGLYIVMALCLTAVMTVGIISLIYDYRQDGFDFSIPEISFPPLTENSNAHPVDNNPSGVDPSVSSPKTVKYAYPLASSSGRVIKEFSPDTLVFSQTMQDYRVHTGVDIAALLGTNVLAFADGVVESITDAPLMGTTVVISHNSIQNGLKSVYMNLDENGSSTLTVGKTVKAGDVIGKVGKTAIVEIGEEPHLHFELHKGNELIDPKPILAEIK